MFEPDRQNKLHKHILLTAYGEAEEHTTAPLPPYGLYLVFWKPLVPFPLKFPGEKLSHNLKLSLKKYLVKEGGDFSDHQELLWGGADWWNMPSFHFYKLQEKLREAEWGPGSSERLSLRKASQNAGGAKCWARTQTNIKILNAKGPQRSQWVSAPYQSPIHQQPDLKIFAGTLRCGENSNHRD